MAIKHPRAVRATATGLGAVALVSGLSLLAQPLLTQAVARPSTQGTRRLAAANDGQKQEGCGGNKQGGREDNDRETDDDANLKASITPAQAALVAQSAQPGTLGKVELENENGTAVYGVHIVSQDGKKHEVKVDANTGKVLKVEADDNEAGENEGEDGDGDGETNDDAK